ncbi:hypothetical protein B6U90_03395 [Thermoplasmatales archaeon ex4484_6]|nr:MAG: hypothetical protein B6U90_03395 [Thermoplasmatales archaeon ex4484_6]RLF68573.1 MAG: hypothetical protein DRN57_03595 [Thermoplasmata archaeon]
MNYTRDLIIRSMVRKRITAVGDMVCDILCSPVSHLDDADVQLELDGLNISPGGNTLNFALAASAFGADVIFHGGRGEDPLGTFLARWMERSGVGDHSRKIGGLHTATTISIPTLSGERRLLTYPGANSRFEITPDQIDLDWTAHLHMGGFWFMKGLAGAPTSEILKECRRRDIQTSMDPASPPFEGRGKMVERLTDALPYLDILFVNEYEIARITGKRDIFKGASMLIDRGVGTVVVHRGETGSSLISGDGRIDLGSYMVLVPRNPTGCGDVFNGCFVAALLEGRSGEEAAEFGMAAAALHMASAEPLYPTRSMVMERVKRGK